MMIVCFFLHIKSLPNLLFGVLCLPGDQSHPFAQSTINPLACCICWAGLLGRAVFPPWKEGPNSGSYNGTTDGLKIGKKVCEGYILSPYLFNSMQSTSCKTLGWMNHKLESRFLGEISITSDMQMTPCLWYKAKRN